MRQTRLQALESALAAYRPSFHPPLPGRTNHLAAGVLVPILLRDEPVVVLTERPPTMRQHAGEVCFPGGRPEEEDADLEATARREAEEEIGLTDVRVVGRLSSIPLLTSEHRLEPFVALAADVPLHPNPAEVRRLVFFELEALLSRPHIDAIAWSNQGREDLSPVFETGGRLLFGATAYVLYELLVVTAPAFGREAPPRRPGRYAWSDVLAR